MGSCRLSWAISMIVGGLVGCGGTTADTASGGADHGSGGGSAGSGGGSAGFSGGSAGFSGGSAGFSGGSAGFGGGLSGGSGGASTGASGGAAGSVHTCGAGGGGFAGAIRNGVEACVESNGQIHLQLKVCETAADCTTIMLPSCCGRALVAGISRDATCAPPSPSGCELVDCEATAGACAEDGRPTDFGVVETGCEHLGDGGSGSCETYVVAHPGTIPCGGATCPPDWGCLHSSSLLPGTVPLAPFCIPLPANCDRGVTCDCLQQDVCGAKSVCQETMARDIFCKNVSP